MSLLIMALPLILMGQQYNLNDLIQQGMEKSWTTQRGRLSYESSASQLSSATWELLPDADLGLRINQNLHNQTPAADLTSSFNFSVSKTISLNDPAWNNYRQAGITKAKAALNLQTSNSAYAYQVFDAYIKVLSAQKQLKSLTENLAIQTRVWEQAKVLRQLGKNTDFDVKQSEIAVMNSRISIMQLENTIRSNRQSLFVWCRSPMKVFRWQTWSPTRNFRCQSSTPRPSTRSSSSKRRSRAPAHPQSEPPGFSAQIEPGLWTQPQHLWR
jgi:outer membrane protein TolC